MDLLRWLPRSTGRTRAFTIIELAVVVAILGILSLLTLSTTGTLRYLARETKCLANLRQIGLAVSLFPLEHRGAFLPAQVEGSFQAWSWGNGLQWDEWVATELGMPPRDDGADNFPTKAFPLIQCPFDDAPWWTDGVPKPVQRRSYAYNIGDPVTQRGGPPPWDWSWVATQVRPGQFKDRGDAPFRPTEKIMITDYVPWTSIGIESIANTFAFGGCSWRFSGDWGTWNPLCNSPPAPGRLWTMTPHARGGRGAVYFDGHAALIHQTDDDWRRYAADIYYNRIVW